MPLDKRVYFIPDVLTSEIMWLGVTTLILIVLSIWFFHAPLENHADPQVTPLGTTAPWYFLWIQGALKLGDKVIWGIVFPTVVILFLMVYPYIDVAKSRRWAHRRVSLTIAFGMAAGFTVLSYMGLSEFGVVNSADIEILHQIVKEPAHNHLGIIRPVPYDKLVPGVYVTRQFEAEEGDVANVINAFDAEINSGNFPLEGGATLLSYLSSGQHLPLATLNVTELPEGTELYRVMEEFSHMIANEDQELYNGWGMVIVTDWQDDLKRVDVIVSWDQVVIERGFPSPGRERRTNPRAGRGRQPHPPHRQRPYLPASQCAVL